jgi:hypothetical protein
MFVWSALLRATRNTGRGVSLVASAYAEARQLNLAARKVHPFLEG